MNLVPGRIVGPGVVETPAGASASLAEAFEAAAGREVEVGIRPEDLRFGSGGEGELAFTKDFVEELGATRLFHGTSGDAPLVVAVAAAAPTMPARASPPTAAGRAPVRSGIGQQPAQRAGSDPMPPR